MSSASIPHALSMSLLQKNCRGVMLACQIGETWTTHASWSTLVIIWAYQDKPPTTLILPLKNSFPFLFFHCWFYFFSHLIFLSESNSLPTSPSLLIWVRDTEGQRMARRRQGNQQQLTETAPNGRKEMILQNVAFTINCSLWISSLYNEKKNFCINFLGNCQ